MAEPKNPGAVTTDNIGDGGVSGGGTGGAPDQSSIGKQFEDAKSAIENLTKTFEAALKPISQHLEEIIRAQAASFAEYSVFASQDKALKQVMDFVHSVEDLGKDTVEVAAIMQRLSGLNADAMQRADYGIDTLSQKATKGAFDAVNKLADTQIKLLDGTSAYALQIASTEEMLETFTESALNDSRLFSAATKGMSEDILLSSTLATKRLGMTTSDLHEIFYRELAATGEMSGEYLNKIEKDLLAAAKVTGDSIVLMSKDLNRMMADFEHFGALAPEQMLSLSHTMHQLGINIRDVTSIADKFQSFDTAISTMSQLAATTGLTLDAVEMFEMANLDPENLVIKLREELDAQGIEFEQMNIIQQRQMAKAFGIDPTTLRVLMNDNLRAAGGLAEDIASEAGKIDDERRKTLLADMDRLEVTQSAELAKRRSSAKTAGIETAQEIEKAYSAAAAATVKTMQSAGSILDAGIAKFKLYRQIMGEVASGFYDIAGVQYIPPGATPTPAAAPGAAGAQAGTPTEKALIPGAPGAPGAPAASTPPQPAAGTRTQASFTADIDNISTDVEAIRGSSAAAAAAAASSAASNASTAASAADTAKAVAKPAEGRTLTNQEIAKALVPSTGSGAQKFDSFDDVVSGRARRAPDVTPPAAPAAGQAATAQPPAAPPAPTTPATPAPPASPSATPTPPVAPQQGSGATTATEISATETASKAVAIKVSSDPVEVRSVVQLSLDTTQLQNFIRAEVREATFNGVDGAGGKVYFKLSNTLDPLAQESAQPVNVA